MKTKIPPTTDIVSALVSIGFVAGEETPTATVVSDGTYTVKVPFEPASHKGIEELRDMLDEIFSYYAYEVAKLTDDENSDAYDVNLKRVAAWATGSNGGL